VLKGVAALLAALAVVFSCATASLAQSGKRVALVIGNADYRFAPPLKNADREADDVGAALERLGFDVTRAVNADLSALRGSIAAFQRGAATADAALVFYSGYALRYRGAGYLVPIDASLKDDASFEWDTLQLGQVIGALARARVSFLIVNGCADGRLDSMLRRPGGTAVSGLGEASARADALIAIATADDPAACEAGGRNGVLVDAMLAEIERAGLDARALFRRVRQVADHRSLGKQTVSVASGMSGPFHFVQDDQPAQAFRALGVDPDLAVMRGYVERYGDDPLASVVKTMLIQKEQASQRPGASAQALERWRDVMDERWSREWRERARASRRDAVEGRMSREDSDRDAEARARLLREQEALRRREAEAAAAEQRRLAEIAAAEQKRQEEERARIARAQEEQRKQDAEIAEKKRQEEVAAAEQKRQEEERARIAREQDEQRRRDAEIAEKKRQEEVAAAEQKRLADLAAVEKKRQDDEEKLRVAREREEKARLVREQEEQRRKDADLAAAEKKRQDDEEKVRIAREREEKARVVREQEEQRRKDAELAAAEKRRADQERVEKERAEREEKARMAREQEEQRKRAAEAAAAEQKRLAEAAAAEKKRQEEEAKARVAREREDQKRLAEAAAAEKKRQEEEDKQRAAREREEQRLREAEAETARRAQLAEQEAAERRKAEESRLAALANAPSSSGQAPSLQSSPVAGNAVNEARQFTATEQRLAQERLERERKARGENPEFTAPLPSETTPQISPPPSDGNAQLASVAPPAVDRPPPDPNFKADSPETIKAAQQELKRLGCYSGNINGNLNNGTKRALDAAGERLGVTASLQPMTEDGLRALRGHQEPLCAPAPTVRRPTREEAPSHRVVRPRPAPAAPRPAPQVARPTPAPSPSPAPARRPGGIQLSM